MMLMIRENGKYLTFNDKDEQYYYCNIITFMMLYKQ